MPIKSEFLAKLFNHSAFLLIFHGSNNPNYLDSSLVLAESIRTLLSDQNFANSEWNSVVSQPTQKMVAQCNDLAAPLIAVANLECTDISLAQRIINFAQQAINQNCLRLILVPVFLSAGVHVLEDIPRELDQAQGVLRNAIELQLTDYVGNFPYMHDLIANRFKKFGSDGKVILAHGSRLRKGNVAVEKLAKAVGASNAFWTIEPDLLQIVKLLIAQGTTLIVIVPYFLFIGRITSIISAQVLEMQKEFPQNKFLLVDPLGESGELAFVIAAQIKTYL